MTNLEHLGIQIPEIYLPTEGIDLEKWAVIACDQFTSEPDYWQQVKQIVGNAPSTFNMILPEIYLNSPLEADRLKSTRKFMDEYLSQKILQKFKGLVLVERTAGGKTRHGLMLALDLEKYDYTKGSKTLIRASEGTIIERLPPRIKIREGAPLEIPHILVLIDDPEKTVIEPLFAKKDQLKKVYDFELMLGSGHLKGYFSEDVGYQSQLEKALDNLTDPSRFAAKYHLNKNEPTLLFAVGDGNHSLATAKAIWEKRKLEVGPNHPSRYALVEIENIHDQGLDFEPIHRVLFSVKTDIKESIKKYFGDRISIKPCKEPAEMQAIINHPNTGSQAFGLITPFGNSTVAISQPAHTLTVGSVQPFLDELLRTSGAEKIDYLHGQEIVFELGKKQGNLGILLPGISKADLFRTVIADGVLPRKTFSMGEAKDKRFYLECRKIV